MLGRKRLSLIWRVIRSVRMNPSRYRKKRAYDKTRGVCIICGKPIADDPEQWSLEHYIPRAVYKWVRSSELESRLESVVNLFVVHIHCNFKKDSQMPSHKTIANIHANDAIKTELHQLYDQVASNIAQYHAMKQSVWDKQGRLCVFCQRPLPLKKAILRRKNNLLDRTKDNAMCLCFRCSTRAGSEKYKHKMVKKKQI